MQGKPDLQVELRTPTKWDTKPSRTLPLKRLFMNQGLTKDIACARWKHVEGDEEYPLLPDKADASPIWV